MIAKLRGVIDSILEDSIIIDVCGVGYHVYVSEKLRSTLIVGMDIVLGVLHIFRQESQSLYGFKDEMEKNIFKALLDVPGVGVKSAMSALSALSPEEFASAVANQDTSIICMAHGIGKKTAERILLELKDKVLTKLGPGNYVGSGNVSDAILGLVSLGYNKNNIVRNVNDIAARLGTNATASDIIFSFLKDTHHSPQ
jgi:Holliday junction DNA helicase RuvA